MQTSRRFSLLTFAAACLAATAQPPIAPPATLTPQLPSATQPAPPPASSTESQPAPQPQIQPPTAPDPSSAPLSTPQILFNRSQPDPATPDLATPNPATPDPATSTPATTDKPTATSPRPLTASKPTVTDAERLAPTFTAYDLDIHLTPAQSALAVEARVTLRNDGPTPLRQLPLQLSSTLHIERVSSAGHPLPLAQHQLASDADHTAQLEETAVTLPQPLAPGASVTLAIAYSGTIAASTARLDRLQTPAAVAASAAWDRISPDFTGLRGFGDVVWYPVSSVPAMLGDGVRLFTEISRQRARQQNATIALRLTDEFTGAAPNIAVLAGQVQVPPAPASMPSASFAGVLQFALPPTRLGFRSPTLFLAERAVAAPAAGPLQVYSTAAHSDLVPAYLAAAQSLQPLLTGWLGTRIAQPEALLELPVSGAQPSEQGHALLASLVAAPPEEIAALLSQELPHDYFRSPRIWLDDGVAGLLATLYEEQSAGRDKALELLASSTSALAFAEPASPGSAPAPEQDLLHATDAIYYRAKALDVLWMLRDLAGDKALSAALRAYDPAADTDPAYFEKLLEQTSGKDLRWFFDAWVYHDRGLPDLSIVNVYSSRTTQADQWLVSVEVANDGYAEAEVPITVRSATTAVTERVRVAARAKTSHRMLILGEPRSVEVNDGTVPEVEASLHKRVID